MSVFTKKINPITGKSEWDIQDENYDYHQETARSAFADMLHDSERNRKYYEAIKVAIRKMHDKGKQAIVLDIGTGTGLLSMMAAKCGADSIVACESFVPIAHCAIDVIHENGFGDKINVIIKNSTDLTVGEEGDLKQKANILVTEVFDTELIGEGALCTFKHAHQYLLEEDCIVVPSSASIYAQVVESNLANGWNHLNCWSEKDVFLETPTNVKKCSGAAAVHDIQLSRFPISEFKEIVPAHVVLRFDWSGKTPLIFERSCSSKISAKVDGVAQIIFMWWDLIMDEENKIILSCAPVWAHPEGKNQPWRDHWMQALFYLPEEVAVAKGDELDLIAFHDEFSLWFNLHNTTQRTVKHRNNHPICDCALHTAFSRTRIGCMNDHERRKKYTEVLKRTIKNESVCLCLSDGSLLAPLAAKLGAQHVYSIETNKMAKYFLESYVSHNCLQTKISILDSVEEFMKNSNRIQQVNFVIGEPYFSSSILPWHNVYFWYLTCELLANNVKIMPAKLNIWALPVEFDNLWKIRAPLFSVEGFTMNKFDTLIKESSRISDHSIEAQPLWEYPCRALSKAILLCEIDLRKNLADVNIDKSGEICFGCLGTCQGVTLWADWDLDGNGCVISTGPNASLEYGQNISWDMHSRQGVYFLPNNFKVDSNSLATYSVSFQPSVGEMNFTFQISKAL